MVTCTVPWGHPDIVELPAAKPWGTTGPRAMSAAKRAISHGPHRTWEAPVDDDTARRGRKSPFRVLPGRGFCGQSLVSKQSRRMRRRAHGRWCVWDGWPWCAFGETFHTLLALLGKLEQGTARCEHDDRNAVDTMPYPGSFSDKVELPLQSSESSRAALVHRWRGSKAADSPTKRERAYAELAPRPIMPSTPLLYHVPDDMRRMTRKPGPNSLLVLAHPCRDRRCLS